MRDRIAQTGPAGSDLPGRSEPTAETSSGTTDDVAPTASDLPAVAAGAILDGSQVIRHDGYDVQAFADAAGAYGRLGRLVEATGQRLHTAPALVRDLFWTAFKAVPRIDPPAPLTPAHAINQQIIQEVMTTREWRDVRAAGTIGDPLTSAMATIGTAGRVLTALDDATVAQINELAALEGAATDLLAQAETLDELAAQASGERVADLFARADAARQAAAEAAARTETLVQDLTTTVEARADTVRRAARAGLLDAVAEIDQASDAIRAFGGGYGVGAGRPGDSPPLSLAEKLALARQVGQSPALQQIATLAGRLVRIAHQVQATRVIHAPDEVTSITTGDDLAHVLPSELARLGDPATEDLFFARHAEQRLLQYALTGHEPQGKGPIILALDASGSMAGAKDVWAKAVALAVLAIAGRQRRDLAVIHFGGTPEELAVFRFPRGQARPQDLITCASTLFGGGTCFEPWLRAALALIDEATFDRADVIVVSDGLVAIDATVQADWQRRRRERGMRVFAVLIGTDQGAGLLASISDALLTLDDLQDDQPTLSTIFAI